MRAASKAFTLMELLVIVCVAGSLVLLALTAAGNAREGSKKIACGVNLKQLGAALHKYADAYDDYLPSCYADSPRPHRLWNSQLWRAGMISNSPELNRCPADPSEKSGHWDGSPWWATNASYGIEARYLGGYNRLSRGDGERHIRRKWVARTDVWVSGDAVNPQYLEAGRNGRPNTSGSLGNSAFGDWHNNGGIVVFLDNSVHWVSADTFNQGDGGEWQKKHRWDMPSWLTDRTFR